MKTIKCIGLFFLAQFLIVISAVAQDAKEIKLMGNAVAFSYGDKVKGVELWGLRVNGTEIFSPQYKSVSYQKGLFVLESIEREWAVSDAQGDIKTRWVEATKVSVMEDFVLFEKTGSRRVIVYDRNTWEETETNKG